MLMFALLCFATGEQKDFEVYSCHVSPDGSRLATAGGGMRTSVLAARDWNMVSNMEYRQMATSGSGQPIPSTTPRTGAIINRASSAI